MISVQETSDATETRVGSFFGFPDGSQILIASEDSSAERLKTILREAGVVSETAKSMTEACQFA